MKARPDDRTQRRSTRDFPSPPGYFGVPQTLFHKTVPSLATPTPAMIERTPPEEARAVSRELITTQRASAIALFKSRTRIPPTSPRLVGFVPREVGLTKVKEGKAYLVL